MMSANLSIELLRSFVAVVEMGSIQKATERIFLTQSALSLQIKRLEDLVGRPLFRRDGGRGLSITSVGTELLEYARQILALNDRALAALRADPEELLRLGVVQAFSESLLPQILRRFHAIHPGIRLEIRVAGTSDLLRALQSNQLDIAVGVSSQPDHSTIGHTPTCWLGKPALVKQDVVPLIALPEPCPFRRIALQALHDSDMKYRIALEVPDLASLQAALQAEMGVTCRPSSLSGVEHADVILPPLLPQLPQIHYTLHHTVPKKSSGWTFVEMLQQAFVAPRGGKGRSPVRRLTA
jgi:DNA-binding transcriptional LysR family regulator